jgi:hypothetical protein
MGPNSGSQADTPAMNWAHGLGEERYAREECNTRTAKAEEHEAARALAASLERWEAIVASIKRLAAAYNVGARRAILSVIEQTGQPTVTVATDGDGAPALALTAALEGTLICLHFRDSSGVAHAAEVRLRPDRDDDATAEYLLQNWMQRL